MAFSRDFKLVSLNAVVTTLIVTISFLFFSPSSINSPDITPESNRYVLRPEESRVVNLIEQVNPAVLSIVVSQDVPVFEQYFESFGPFGFQIPRQRQRGTEERQVGSGTGFIVSDEGLVITNRHVVNIVEAEYIGMDFKGNKYDLELIERDPVLDIAVLKIKNSQDLPFLRFGDSNQLQVGQSVIAIGNALGEFSNSVSVGVVSGLSRSIVAGSTRYGEQELLENVIQTDAAINPGNSGGPLLNLDGAVIGVNVAVASGSENIGFALPANEVQSIVESIQEFGRIVRPFLGVRYVRLNSELVEQFDLSTDEGVLVYGSGLGLAVVPGSPADKAGIREGDVITDIANQALTDSRSLATIIRDYAPGDEVIITIRRGNQTLKVPIILEEFRE